MSTEEKKPIGVGDTFMVPSGEVPHLFIQPEAYVPGFNSEQAAIKKVPADSAKIKHAVWPGAIAAEQGSQPVEIVVSAPGFIAKAVAGAKGRDPSYKVTVRPRKARAQPQ